MADPAKRALEELLAGQARADEQHSAVMRRLGTIEEVQRQQVAAIVGLTQAFGTLNEAVTKLSDAANSEPKKKAKDIGKALRALTKVVAEGNVIIGRAANGVAALPGMVETIAIRAATLAQGGGVEPPDPT